MGERAAYLFLEAGRDDLGELARMRVAWSEATGRVDAEAFEARLRAWWDRQSGLRQAFLVRPAQGGAAVAMANVAVFERMPRPAEPDARWAYVANVWVDPQHRRRGVGTLLMTGVVDWCRRTGMQRIVLNPSAVSVPLYRGLGFRPADDLLRLDLAPPGA